MFDHITLISDRGVSIKLTPQVKASGINLMNMHVIFEDNNKLVLGEVEDVSKEIIKVHFLGEIKDNKFIGGVLRKPTLEARIRIINDEELKLIIGDNTSGKFMLGLSPLYDDKPIYIDINKKTIKIIIKIVQLKNVSGI